MSIVPFVFHLTIVKVKDNQIILTKWQVQTAHFPSSCCTYTGNLSLECTHISYLWLILLISSLPSWLLVLFIWDDSSFRNGGFFCRVKLSSKFFLHSPLIFSASFLIYPFMSLCELGCIFLLLLRLLSSL